MQANTQALEVYLKPLEGLLMDSMVSEISINTPEEVYVERGGRITVERISELNGYWLEGLARLIANATQQRLSEKEPLLSASLPQGHRIQVVLPPVCPLNSVILSIRKQVIRNLSLEDYDKMDAFSDVKPYFIKNHRTEMNLTA